MHSSSFSYEDTLEEVGVGFLAMLSTGRHCVSVHVRCQYVCPLTFWFVTTIPLIPCWHWSSVFSRPSTRRVSCSLRASTEGARGATLAEEGEERHRWGRGEEEEGEERVEERGHISILLTAFLFSLTHTLSPRHILCWEAGRKGREQGEGEGRE